MPFRKKKNDGTYRDHWFVRRKNLPGFGDTGTLSTGTTLRDRAAEMELLLVDLANHGHYDILEAVRPAGRGKSGRITLPELLRKKTALQRDYGRGWRDELVKQINDPPLEAFAREVGKQITYENHRRGVQHLLALLPTHAPQHVCVSWLRQPSNIDTLVRAMLADGYKPNSVLNSLWGAISKILQAAYDRGAADQIMKNARRPYKNDAREVWLTPEELYEVISYCEWEVRMFVILCACLGIDQSPVLRIRARDVDRATWRLWVRDNKNQTRKRPINLNPAAAYTLHVLSRDKMSSQKLFCLSGGQIYHRWRNARKEAGLCREKGFPDDVRIKDLRHTFAVHYLQGGGNIAGLMNRMGHRRPEQSMLYAKHERQGTSDMEAAAQNMGLHLPAHLRSQLPEAERTHEQAFEMPEWWFDRNALPKNGSIIRRWAKRGTAGYAEDPKKWNRERMRKKRTQKKAS